MTIRRSEIVSYYFYLANGLHIFQALPFDFQALYRSGVGVCVGVFLGGCAGGYVSPGGKQATATQSHSLDTHPTTATHKSVFDA